MIFFKDLYELQDEIEEHITSLINNLDNVKGAHASDFEEEIESVDYLLEKIKDFEKLVLLLVEQHQLSLYMHSEWELKEFNINTRTLNIENALRDLKTLFLQKTASEEIMKKVKAVKLEWDKMEEDLFNWQRELGDSGLPFTENITLFGVDDFPPNDGLVFLTMLKNALQAEKLYYSLQRNKKFTSLVNIRNTMFFNRKTNSQTQPIEISDFSGRSIISTYISSVELALSNVDQKKLTDGEKISKELGWHKKKKSNWNRETIYQGRHQQPYYVKYQFKPQAGQLANMIVYGVGRYGKEKRLDILAVFNKLTNGETDKEKTLASLLIRYKYGDGEAICENSLIRNGLYLPTTDKERNLFVTRFQKFAYLICFLEVSRRKTQGYRKIGDAVVEVPELPFGIAISCVLKLISDGHLSIAEVFDKDTLYGVFTGSGAMSNSFKETIKKFNSLFILFLNKYAPVEELQDIIDFSEGAPINMAFSPEFFHKILQETEGGEEDSDGEEYQPAGNVQEEEFLEIREASQYIKIESTQLNTNNSAPFKKGTYRS